MPAALALVLALLSSTPGTAPHPQLPECRAPHQRVELAAGPQALLPWVCISPGLVTNLLFDEPLPKGAVSLSAEERHILLAHDGRAVMLMPSETLRPGTPLELTVRFADGAAPASATFILVVHPARAHQKVEVFRQRRPVEAYERELRERDAEVARCREDNERLRAARGQAQALTGLLATGAIGDGGVAFRDLFDRWTEPPGSVVHAVLAASYRARARVALKLRLSLAAADPPWVADGASLVGTDGQEVRVLSVWQSAPLTAEEDQFVIIEAEATIEQAQGDLTLKLWESGGARTLPLGGVAFPQLPTDARPQ